MARSPLFGRRVHISGSFATDPMIASGEAISDARGVLAQFVQQLVRRGANFVVPVDAEPCRPDGNPICFDWDIWEAMHSNLAARPLNVPGPMVIAVKHHKTEEQIPPDRVTLWDGMAHTDLVHMESAAQWSMAARRMDIQSRFGDILITLGGDEGVLHLANRYHEAGKPVIPLDLAVTGKDRGSRKLYTQAQLDNEAARFFRVTNGGSAHGWVNRLQMPARHSVEQRVAVLVDLLEALERPRAFAVRLLNPGLPDFAEVDSYFEAVVRPVVEDELGYELTVIDDQHRHEHARIDEEIFVQLARASLVVADLTGGRPNCFLELGFAFGRSIPTLVSARKGSRLPFDVNTISTFLWSSEGTIRDRRRLLREHWDAVRNRPPLVQAKALVR
ncbi:MULTISPECIES: hypothetical protein [Sphingobium]|uniref:ATP nucleosidase Cap17-like N-terminal domain-containing protein n=1 Tax=Sphingobium limneticum TaxID=1007511 RepID=A0A5J5HS68_9SPHN|nr:MULTISPECIES: hypothetical protein [Sphingobium]KAA9012971.1 hypothetical protein F4U96_20155 [Sphingobium limneticum]KAA9025217.1 hypothetical protein F4U95_20280 [Sphingobium limneticum]